MKVTYTVQKGETTETIEDSVRFNDDSLSYVVDFRGILDKYGREVTDTKEIVSGKVGQVGIQTTSTRVEYPPAEILAIHLSVADASGAPLYIGAWPQAASEVVVLPDRLRERVFTDLQGRTITGTVQFVGTESVTILFEGRSIDVKIAVLSEPDREFLANLRRELENLENLDKEPSPAAEATTPKKTE